MPTVRNKPVWAGPSGEGPNGGITQSLLSEFLVCRERFRLHVVEGLAGQEGFDKARDYGTMWHACEEAWAEAARKKPTERGGLGYWANALLDCGRKMARQYPTQREQVEHWYQVCKRTFPHYVRFWQDHPDPQPRSNLLAEQPFDVVYALPSGRSVRLRGKWDGVDLVPEECDQCGGLGTWVEKPDNPTCSACKGSGNTGRQGVWLFETKTTGEVDEEKVEDRLRWDLQTMLYLAALETLKEDLEWMLDPDNGGTIEEGMRAIDPFRDALLKMRREEDFVTLARNPIKGVRYNVVRRPLSGGKGTIVRHKARGSIPEETLEHFYQRVEDYVQEEPQAYFHRWDVPVSSADVQCFRRETLDPILEQLCDWWGWINHSKDPFAANPQPAEDENIRLGLPYGLHWRMPTGVWNPLARDGRTVYDDCLETGSRVGLAKVTNLFPELQE